jgi:hypothetical protein
LYDTTQFDAIADEKAREEAIRPVDPIKVGILGRISKAVNPNEPQEPKGD